MRLPLVASVAAGGAKNYHAPWPSELVSTLPVVHYPSQGPRVWCRVAHVFVPNVEPGDLIDAAMSVLVTNDLAYTVELAGCLVLTNEASGTCGIESVIFGQNGGQGYQSDRLRFITRVPGFNVSPQRFNYPNDVYPGTEFEFPGAHHETLAFAKFWTVPQGVEPGDYWVAAIVYAGGSTHTTPGDQLIVEPHGTDLSVKHTSLR